MDQTKRDLLVVALLASCISASITYSKIIELVFVGTPDRVVQVVFVSDNSKRFIRVVGDYSRVIRPWTVLAGLAYLIETRRSKTYRNRYIRPQGSQGPNILQ